MDLNRVASFLFLSIPVKPDFRVREGVALESSTSLLPSNGLRGIAIQTGKLLPLAFSTPGLTGRRIGLRSGRGLCEQGDQAG